MDPSIIQLALQKMRGQTPGGAEDAMAAPQMQAPMPQTPGLDQAYGQPMQGQAGGQSPFQLNQALEQQAQGQNSQLNPLMQQIMQRFGILSMLRNRGNQQMVDPG